MDIPSLENTCFNQSLCHYFSHLCKSSAKPRESLSAVHTSVTVPPSVDAPQSDGKCVFFINGSVSPSLFDLGCRVGLPFTNPLC